MANVKEKKIGMTTREFINGFLSGKSKEDTLNGMTYEQKAEELLAAMDKRNAAKKEATAGKPSKTAIENEPIKKAIEEYLENCDTSVLAKDIATAIEQSVNKTSAVVRQMVADGSVERIDLGRNKPLEYRLVR
jgi:cell fate (sporulation/competence/biofilm development) regulator YmcA (YheA/YmcA/DUF963 family)